MNTRARDPRAAILYSCFAPVVGLLAWLVSRHDPGRLAEAGLLLAVASGLVAAAGVAGGTSATSSTDLMVGVAFGAVVIFTALALWRDLAIVPFVLVLGFVAGMILQALRRPAT